MDSFEEIQENIYKYLETVFEGERVREKYDIPINEITSLSNYNYNVTVFDRENQKKVLEVLYRKFGEIKDCVDQKLEATIIENLSDSELSPKILFQDPEGNYRIEEFLSETVPLEKESQFKSDIIDQIIQICISYSLISSIYTFKLQSGLNFGLSYNIVIDYGKDYRKSDVQTQVSRNFFEVTLDKLYEKAYEKFDIFLEKIKSIAGPTDEGLSEDLDTLEYYMNNFRSLFEFHHPKRGYCILNHNSLHRNNVLFNKILNKCFVIDHEFAGLNLIGFDFVNYLNESLFEYSPNYAFYEDDINFDEHFELYLQYINRFEQERPELNETADGRKILEEVKGKAYFHKLYHLVNLFWILYCAKYLNADNFIEKKGFNYFQHAIDRIKLIEALPEDEINLQVSNFF